MSEAMSGPLSRLSFSLNPVPPYDFNLTAAYATYFRSRYGTDSYENGVFRRLLDIDGDLLLAEVSSSDATGSPRLEANLSGQNPDTAIAGKAKGQITRILGIDRGPGPFYTMALADPALARLARALYGLHIPQTGSVFEALVLAILGQQISAQVAFKLRNSLIEKYGPRLIADGKIYHAFPRPDSLAATRPDDLRAIGLSARKAEYVLDIAGKAAAGVLDLEGLRDRPGAEIIASLTSLRGVGGWTAHWLLIRAFGYPDGFPASDLALLRMVGNLMGKGKPVKPEEADEYSKRWSPFRSYVTTYLFAAVRSGRAELLEPVKESGQHM